MYKFGNLDFSDIWLELEMLVFSVGITIMDDNMSVKAWFDESGKDGMSLTTSEEYAGFRW